MIAVVGLTADLSGAIYGPTMATIAMTLSVMVFCSFVFWSLFKRSLKERTPLISYGYVLICPFRSSICLEINFFHRQLCVFVFYLFLLGPIFILMRDDMMIMVILNLDSLNSTLVLFN